jgi:LuxR family transcriptional regulator, maltose regulon positive regulatory protein
MDEGQAMATTRPAAPSTIIKRPRLTKLLDESAARILLLCAPAGYGKTTLAREWIATRAEPVAWYRGGIEMLDAAAVALALIEVLRGIGLSDDDAGRLTARASRDSRSLDLGRAIGSALLGSPSSLLVIDDYHHAVSAESESLLGAFAEAADLRILITSRTRPTWLTPRMQVYGEALVVGTDQLAFTDEEASAVMANLAPSRPESFVAQARGWPAVIGLAARQTHVTPSRTRALPLGELYEYFAEDLLQQAPAYLHDTLFLLALTGGADSDVTQDLLGVDCDIHLNEASERGFVSRNSSFECEMHPLLRSFLLTKLHELDELQSKEIVDRALRSLGRARRWDTCLAVLAEFPGSTLVTALLEEALDELLASGRLATIKRWLSVAPSMGGERAVLLLAEAEVSAREGQDAQAKTIAEQAAELSAASELAARAHLVAARAAHMLCDDAGTLANAARAIALTRLSHIRIQARRFELMNAVEAENGRARDLLELLRAERHRTPEQTLLLSQATGLLALLADGDVRQAVLELEPGLALLHHVADPIHRTAFLNVLATAFLWFAEYDRALEVIALQIDDASAAGLDFAVEHALAAQAGAHIGLRQLGMAQRILNDLESRASASAFISNEIHLLGARLRAAAGDLERAEILVRGSVVGSGITRSARGERLGLRALYLASTGNLSAARLAVRNARETSTYLQAQSFGELALAIIDLQEGDESDFARSNHDRIARVIDLGQLDPLVHACRAYPPLTKWVASDEALAHELTKILAGSRDVAAGRAAGLKMPRELRKTELLSNRENEVYELLAQGRSNREIAKTLFISESTTKVHVRHILEKLKVHTRAEAAAAKISTDT